MRSRKVSKTQGVHLSIDIAGRQELLSLKDGPESTSQVYCLFLKSYIKAELKRKHNPDVSNKAGKWIRNKMLLIVWKSAGNKNKNPTASQRRSLRSGQEDAKVTFCSPCCLMSHVLLHFLEKIRAQQSRRAEEENTIRCEVWTREEREVQTSFLKTVNTKAGLFTRGRIDPSSWEQATAGPSI